MARRNGNRAAARVLVAFALVLTGACDRLPDSELPFGLDVPAADPGGGLPTGAFATPEGVAVARGLAFVANPNVRFVGQSLVFGPGFVTIVRLSDGAVLERVEVSARNPQAVAASGDRVAVLCSGATTFDGTVVTPAGDGALVVLDASEAAAGRPARVREIPLPRSSGHPLVGYPSSLALSSDGSRAWVGSGTAPALFLVDLVAGTVLRGADDPVALGDLDVQDTVVVRSGPPGVLLVGRFETDEVVVRDAVTGDASPTHPDPFAVGPTAAPDGVQDIAYRPGGSPDVFVLLGLASSITAADLGMGSASLRTRFARTGTYPNRLLLAGNRLLVVNSGDNNVEAFDPDTGASLGTVAKDLPAGTNPYDLAVWQDGARTYAAITAQGADALYVVDLDTGATVREVRP